MVKPRGHFNQPALWSSLMVILATKHHQLITCLFVRPGQKDITVIRRNQAIHQLLVIGGASLIMDPVLSLIDQDLDGVQLPL